MVRIDIEKRKRKGLASTWLHQNATRRVSICVICVFMLLFCGLAKRGIAQQQIFDLGEPKLHRIPLSRPGGLLGHGTVDPYMSRLDEQRVWQTLNQYDDMPWENWSVQKIASYISQQYLPCSVDEMELENYGVSKEEELAAPVSPGKLGQRLTQALGQLELAYMVKGGGMLLTSQDCVEDEPPVRVYDVSPLLVETVNLNSGRRGLSWKMLQAAIIESIEPDSWLSYGGTGSIQPLVVPGRELLVVATTPQNHLLIAELLKKLVASADRRAYQARGRVIYNADPSPQSVFGASEVCPNGVFGQSSVPQAASNGLPSPFRSLPRPSMGL